MITELQPRVTVGLPVYNGADYIDKALDALLRQSFRDFFLIISDNQSTDGTWQILQSWAARDRRIILHRQPTNIGHLGNFRYVLNQACTEYFMWHAHDDSLSADYIERLVGVLDQDESCLLAAASIRHVDPCGTELRYMRFPCVQELPRSERIRQLLRQPRAAYFYGLFRTDSLRAILPSCQRFRHVIAHDRILLIAFILRDALRGSPDAEITITITPLTAQRYYPKTAWSQLSVNADYMYHHLRLLHEAPLPALEKIACIPALLDHRRQTLSVGVYQETIGSYLRKLRRNPLKALFLHPLRVAGRVAGGLYQRMRRASG